MNLPDHIRVSVQKVLSQLATIARSYNLVLWKRPEERNLWEHDLGVMLAWDDLTLVALQLASADNTMLFEFAVRFNGSHVNAARDDTAAGVELPVQDRRKVAYHRMIVRHGSRFQEYRHLLRGNWGRADQLANATCDEYESEHARRITGGRQSGVSRHRRRTASSDRHPRGIARFRLRRSPRAWNRQRVLASQIRAR